MEMPLVSVLWLNEYLTNDNLRVLNATMTKVTDENASSETQQIPKALFFDIKNKFSDPLGRFPNTLPSTEQFNSEAQNLGINNNSLIVVYDDYGFYSCARAWWLFKAFGHKKVYILDGGLPEWKNSGFQTEKKQEHTLPNGNFKGLLNPSCFKFFSDIELLKTDKNTIILDARSKDRFDGLLPEPREGLRSGHIPNSLNVPFQKLLLDNTMRPVSDLKAIFKSVNPGNKTMVLSCGSGITACILALGASMAGYENISIYDGSWTEYGTLTN